MPSTSEHDHATAWLGALENEPVRVALESVYRDAAERIAHRRPLCTSSGRCCHFERYGHRLYTTGLETAYTVRALANQAHQRHGPANALALPVLGQTGDHDALPPRSSVVPALTPGSLEDALDRGACPFQIDNLCTVHAVKPLACRMYFCDPSAQDWMTDTHERLINDIRELHVSFALPYRYAEWRSLLAMFIDPTRTTT